MFYFYADSNIFQYAICLGLLFVAEIICAVAVIVLRSNVSPADTNSMYCSASWLILKLLFLYDLYHFFNFLL